jgi:hypothetical protein
LADAVRRCSSSLQDFNSRWPDLEGAFAASWLQTRGQPATAAGAESAASAASFGNAGRSSGSQQQQVDIGQLYADVLRLCRAVAAAAPLPRVCNHLGCENLAGSSEAAAVAKVCGGCGAGYCSAACQAADRWRHKHACRMMMAAGQICR